MSQDRNMKTEEILLDITKQLATVVAKVDGLTSLLNASNSRIDETQVLVKTLEKQDTVHERTMAEIRSQLDSIEQRSIDQEKRSKANAARVGNIEQRIKVAAATVGGAVTIIGAIWYLIDRFLLK